MSTIHAKQKPPAPVLPVTLIEQDLTKLGVPELCAMHIQFKKAEELVTADRVKVEQALIAHLGLPEIDKQKTHSPEGFKVTIKSGASYKMDWPMWGEVRGEIPENLRPTKWIEAIDKQKLKYLRSANKEVFAKLSTALTTTPNKPGVTVEPHAIASPADQRSA